MSYISEGTGIKSPEEAKGESKKVKVRRKAIFVKCGSAAFLFPFAFYLFTFTSRMVLALMMNERPRRKDFTSKEWRVIQSKKTPRQVQRYLSSMPYNWMREGTTIRSFREVVRRNEAHCLEAALVAAVIMEQHGHAPLLLSLESKDKLDHVVFIFRQNSLWGAVARSRDIGLHGRKPVFRTIRQLAWSYFDPYVDLTGRITGYGVGDLRELNNYDWRFSPRNLWKVENYLREIPHRKIRSSERRYKGLLARYKEFKREHPLESPAYFQNRHQWML